MFIRILSGILNGLPLMQSLKKKKQKLDKISFIFEFITVITIILLSFLKK